MTTLIALSILPFVSLSTYASPNACAEKLIAAPSARQAAEILPDGRVGLQVDYSTDVIGIRQLHLPSIVTELVGQKNLRIIVLAGNCGNEYDHTYHSLAHRFGDYLVEAHPTLLHSTIPDYTSRETLHISYDDQSTRPWTTNFKTEVPRFRTESGEAIYYSDFLGAPILLVRMFGDYNEVGDFAVPFLDLLGLPPSQLLLVQDGLKVAEGINEISVGTQAYNGNNAQLSIIRNLSYGVFNEVLAELRRHYAVDEIQANKWRNLANIRQRNHLGDPYAYKNFMFRNSDQILNGLVSAMDSIVEQMDSSEKLALTELRAKMKEIKSPMGPLMAKLKDRSIDAETRTALEQKREAIFSLTKPIDIETKKLEAYLKTAKERLREQLRPIVENRLTFATLAIGTDNGKVDPERKAEFVLSPYPTDIFNATAWEKTTEAMRHWIQP